MSPELTNLEKLRRVPWHFAGNALNGIFCVLTFFGSVFVLFLSEMNLDKTRIGFLLALMPFCGLVAPLVAKRAARFGFKRTFILFYGLRKVAAGLILLTPLVCGPYFSSRLGFNAAFLWITLVVFGFALFRSIAETASYPWSQENIPHYIRGKFGAINGIITTLVSIATIFTASYVISHDTGINRFLVLIGFGTVAGFFSVWCYSHIPGGLPVKASETETGNFRQMVHSLKDCNFRRFLLGSAFVTLGWCLSAFIPLFMKEQVGLAAGTIVLLDIASSLGVLLSCYLWGWASDRYGSKPIMLSGLSAMVLLPVFWFLLPRHHGSSTSLAMAISFIAGVSITGWGTGFSRYLFVSAVPAPRKTAYMAVFYAWAGLVGGAGPLLAGRLLDYCQNLNEQFYFLHLDPFTPLFVLSFALLILGLLTMNVVHADGALPVRKFMSMFIQGNPFVALGSLIRYARAGDETDRVLLTERMGDAKNPLSENELIEALGDPSFSVRYEAIIAVSRLPPDPKLIDALLLVLVGSEPDLSIAAAWALGKLGDTAAILPLRETLLSEFQLLQVQSARSLAKLGDTGSIPFFLEKLRAEPNHKLRLAYAGALGTLKVREATDDILGLLKITEDPVLRGEVALALARIVGPERYYIHLWRSARVEAGTFLAQTVLDLGEKMNHLNTGDSHELGTLIQDCATRFSQNQMIQGVALLSVLLRKLPADLCAPASDRILRECAERLTEFGPNRLEYVFLALHTLQENLAHPFCPLENFPK